MDIACLADHTIWLEISPKGHCIYPWIRSIRGPNCFEIWSSAAYCLWRTKMKTCPDNQWSWPWLAAWQHVAGECLCWKRLGVCKPEWLKFFVPWQWQHKPVMVCFKRVRCSAFGKPFFGLFRRVPCQKNNPTIFTTNKQQLNQKH